MGSQTGTRGGRRAFAALLVLLPTACAGAADAPDVADLRLAPEAVEVDPSTPDRLRAEAGFPAVLWGPWVEPRTPCPVARGALRQARETAGAGDLERACAVLDRASEASPSNAAVAAARGACLAALGFARPAELELQRATRLDPGCAEAWWALGRVRLELGLVRGAAEALSRARALGLDHPDLRLSLARAAREEGRVAEALGEYAAVLEAVRPRASVLVEAASVLLEPEAGRPAEADLDRALGWVARAAALDPTSTEPDLVAGLLHARAGRDDDARRAWSRALGLESDPVRRRALEDLLVDEAEAAEAERASR